MVWGICIGIIVLLLLILIVPIRVRIKYTVKTKENTANNQENIDFGNHIKIYILQWIKVKTFHIKNKEKDMKDNPIEVFLKLATNFLQYQKLDKALLKPKDLKTLNESLYFQKLDMELGFNTQNVIYNAYAIALANAIINMYICKNAEKFDLEQTSYHTYISSSIFQLKLDCIISFQLAHTIVILIKMILMYRKVVDKNGRTTTSDRKSNDDSHDIAREYD